MKDTRKQAPYDPAKRRERYLRNRKRNIEYGLSYYDRNKERLKAKMKEYYRTHRDTIIKQVTENRTKYKSKTV